MLRNPHRVYRLPITLMDCIVGVLQCGSALAQITFTTVTGQAGPPTVNSPAGGGTRNETSVPLSDSLVPERDSNSTKAGIVHREDLNGRAANLCRPDQVCTVPFEMITPSVPPRVKELDDFA